ncbi:hypothetical protein G6F31_012844 [Rhizopus arrhizus]|nr:hypothetical protein G6F31_012844 [Rhizopus arrhizus]
MQGDERDAAVNALFGWLAHGTSEAEIAFQPGRVLMHDTTSTPALVDIAAMRDALAEAGVDPAVLNPVLPVDVSVDHSLAVEAYAQPDAATRNLDLELRRNAERYRFLRWASKALSNVRIHPPGTGIMHTINLEQLATVVCQGDDGALHPDMMIGTDSHTPMINGIGVLGWGVGGLEAQTVMFGMPTLLRIPDVIGVRLTGALAAGVTATDLVLTITEMLRREKVVGKFVEFCGEGTASLTVAERATIGNMAPEYGATMGFFPVDERTIDYFRGTGRTEDEIAAFEAYFKAQKMFGIPAAQDINFTKLLTLDLSTVAPSLAGPKRPQDRVLLEDVQKNYREALVGMTANRDKRSEDVSSFVNEGGGAAVGNEQLAKGFADIELENHKVRLKDGAVVIAAITSCTNTSNPAVMIGAGLLARNAAAKGLNRQPWVKTSLGPGSRVVTDYLEKAGVLKALEKIGFYVVGYGCTTCIGNSGPLPTEVSAGIAAGDLVVTSVLSGNRNFEGRVHPEVKMNYLASPPLVVAYAIAGTTDIDLTTQPLGTGSDGQPVFLRDIWPSNKEIGDVIAATIGPEMFKQNYADVFKGDTRWNTIASPDGNLPAASTTCTVHA